MDLPKNIIAKSERPPSPEVGLDGEIKVRYSEKEHTAKNPNKPAPSNQAVVESDFRNK